jgi:hypothetical protein
MSANKEDSLLKQKEGENNNNSNWENKTSGYREPSWYANIIRQSIKIAKLTSNISSAKVDVIIVGGGIVGMTTSYLLSKFFSYFLQVLDLKAFNHELGFREYFYFILLCMFTMSI